MPDQQILVVGTTPDYVELIRRRFGRKSLFLTDPALRAAAREPQPPPEEEILCDLKNFEQTFEDLKNHLTKTPADIAGVSCFDCESLALAAYLAGNLGLRFPSVTSVLTCRNKFLSKQAWRQAGIDCPMALTVQDAGQLRRAVPQLGIPVILKPMTGSGSELIFKCGSVNDAVAALNIIQRRLAVHPNTRMYGDINGSDGVHDSRRDILAEKFIAGREYSCDFILEGEQLEIVRMASKIPAGDQPMGTTQAYVVPGQGFSPDAQELLKSRLYRAARASGLDHAVCMADFIVAGDTIYLLEISPRLGGDCLPPLIRASSGLDIIGLALDFSTGKPIDIPEKSKWKTRVGLRIFSPSAGIIQNMDAGALDDDPAILSRHFKTYPGYKVVLPPADYDSRILGHVIFEPDPNRSIASQCESIRSKIHIHFRD